MPSHQYREPTVETRRSYDGRISTMGPPFRQDDTPYWIRTQVISDKQLNDLFMSQCITWSEYTESCHDAHPAISMGWQPHRSQIWHRPPDIIRVSLLLEVGIRSNDTIESMAQWIIFVTSGSCEAWYNKNYRSINDCFFMLKRLTARCFLGIL